MFKSKHQIMKICVLNCMNLLRSASQCQNPFCGKRVVWVQWLSVTKDKGHVIPKHSPHDIPSQQLHIPKTFTTFAKCIFNSWKSPLGRSYPRLVWALDRWMTICSSFIEQLIRFEMMEAFISTIQIVISLDSPFESERKCFSKITRIYNLAHKLLRLRSKRSRWWRKAFISLPSHLQRNIPC